MASRGIGAAVKPTVGTTLKAIENRIGKTMQSVTSTGMFKRMFGQAQGPQGGLNTPEDTQEARSGVLGDAIGALAQGLKELTHGLKAKVGQLSVTASRRSKKKAARTAEKLNTYLDYLETGVEVVSIYRSDQTPEEKAEGYGEVAGGVVGARVGAAFGARVAGPDGRALGERLGGVVGERLGAKLAGDWFTDDQGSESPVTHSERKPVGDGSGALVRADAAATGAPRLIPLLTAMGPLKPGAGPLAGDPRDKPTAPSLNEWMGKHWFAPVQANKPSTEEHAPCKPCPCEVGKAVRCTTVAAPAEQAAPVSAGDTALALGSVAIAGTLRGGKALPGLDRVGKVPKNLGSGVMGKVKGVFGRSSTRKGKQTGDVDTGTESLPDPPTSAPAPSIASKMWTGVKSVAPLSLLEAGYKVAKTALTAETAEEKADGYGGALGGLGGALAGAALGSAVPVIGTAVGALVGGLAGDDLGSLLARRWFAPDAADKPSVKDGAGPVREAQGATGRSLGEAARAIAPSTAELALMATLPATQQTSVTQQAPLNQQFTFAPNMPVTVQGNLSDPMQLAQEVGAIVRRQFDELVRQATSRQLYDVPHVI
ncbi:hypothetical protein ACIQUS_04240 [Pseudomonas sp. NPDC090755]|uniref:hypothetical protein n=1 Tax=Pseudomonas sp. NPDC090755 TaxID=3364481 RepID=UPI00383AD3E0